MDKYASAIQGLDLERVSCHGINILRLFYTPTLQHSCWRGGAER